MTRFKMVPAACAWATFALATSGAAYTTTSDPTRDEGHEFIFNRVPAILANDGFGAWSAWAAANLNDMVWGSNWADHSLGDPFGVPLAAASHYMDLCGNGLLWTFPSAGAMADRFYLLAATAWARGDRRTAARAIGVVCHLIQDATVPHHANLQPLFWHSQYEQEVDRFCGGRTMGPAMTATGGGLYDFNWWRMPWWRVHDCVRASWALLPLVDGLSWWPNVPDDPGRVARAMVPLAQRATAGAIAWFLWMVRA